LAGGAEGGFSLVIARQRSATQPITGITLEGGSQLSTIPPISSGDGDSSDGGSVGVRV